MLIHRPKPMNRIQLRPGLHFWLKGREYVIEQRLAEGELLLREVVTQVSTQIKQTTLIQLLFQGELAFELIDASRATEKKQNYLQADFASIPEKLRFEAKRKYLYVSQVLESNLPSKTKVKYNPTDLGSIYVFDAESYQFIEVPALNQEYAQGLTLWQHKVIKLLARTEAEKVDLVALALAKEKIQSIVECEWQKSKKRKTRTSMARWLGIGFEALATDDFPASNLDWNQKTAQASNVVTHQNNSLAGISELGNAYISSNTQVSNTDEKLSENFILSATIFQFICK
jgi:hypothetical protein